MPTSLPDVVRMTVSGTYDAERWVNVLHFQRRDSAPVTATDITNLANLLAGAVGVSTSLLKWYRHTDTGLVIDTLRGISLDDDNPVESSVTTSISGTSAGGNLPPMLSMIVRWKTATATRNYRGRTYMSGVGAGMVSTSDADRLDGALATSLAVDANAFATAWGANATWAFLIMSETERQNDVLEPYRKVLSASVNPLFGVQRRRRTRQ